MFQEGKCYIGMGINAQPKTIFHNQIMKEKTIYLLIGPKGSGKTYIGTLIQKTFKVKFVRVEDWAKTIRRGRAIDNHSYLQDVFQAIEKGITEEVIKNENVVFESTGITHFFDGMYNRLSRDFRVVSINVTADDELCLTRVQNRDKSIHIDVSDEDVIRINKVVREKRFNADFSIVNNKKTEAELIEELRGVFR